MLTGSERPTDELAARGQGDLLGAEPAARAPEPNAALRAERARLEQEIAQRQDYKRSLEADAVADVQREIDALGRDRLERAGIIKPGESTPDWLERLATKRSTFERGRKLSATGMQDVSRKGIWTADGEPLRKAVKTYLTARRREFFPSQNAATEHAQQLLQRWERIRAIDAELGAEPAVKASRLGGGAPQRGPSAAQTAGPARRPDEIIHDLGKALDVPIRYGRVAQRSAGAIFKVKPQVIRRKRWNDLEAVSHEVGHLLEERFGALRALMEQHKAELHPLASPGPDKLSEGFAEYMRLRLSQPGEAASRAPKFDRMFSALLENHPQEQAVLARAADEIDAWFRLPPEERLASKIGERPRTLGERVEGLGRRTVQQMLDGFNQIKVATRDLADGAELAPSRDPYVQARLSKGSDGEVDHFLRKGTLPFAFDARAEVAGTARFGKSLADVLGSVGDDIDGFERYMTARRAKELLGQGRERLFTREEVDGTLKRYESPRFSSAFDALRDYQDQVLQYGRDGGLMSDELYAKVKAANADYVPFKRLLEPGPAPGKRAGGQLANQGSPVATLHGASLNIEHPIQSIIDNTALIVTATNRNYAAATMARLAESKPGGGRWMERLPAVPKALRVRGEDIVARVEAAGGTIDRDVADAIGEWQTFWQAVPKAERGRNQVLVRMDGKPAAFEVDPALYESLANLAPPDVRGIESLLAGFGRTLRGGVVFDPSYMLRNLSRDQLTAWVQSKHGYIPGWDAFAGMARVATKSKEYWQFMAFGGGQSSFWTANDRQATRYLHDLITDRPKDVSWFRWNVIDNARKAGALIEKLGEITEGGSRLGEFTRATSQSGPRGERLLEGAMAGRDVSTDFAMHGASRSLWFMTRITPFLNAGIQGLYKGARALGEDGFKRSFLPVMTKVIGGLTVPSLGLWAWTHKEQWYQDLPDWEKLMYWHLPPATEGGAPLRIPKPFEFGFLGGTLPTMLAETWYSDLKAREGARIADAAMQVFGLRVLPPALLVPIEWTTNYNFFAGRQTVPAGVTPGPYDYSTWTSETAKAVAKATGVSARKLEQAVRGLFGSLGVLAMEGTDVLLRLNDASLAPRPAAKLTELPGVRPFFSRYPQYSSGPVDHLYGYLAEFGAKYDAIRKLQAEGNFEEANKLRDAFVADNGMQIHSMARTGTQALSQDAKLIGRIVRGEGEYRTMSPEERRRLQDQAIEERNALARDFLERIQRAEAAGKRAGIAP